MSAWLQNWAGGRGYAPHGASFQWDAGMIWLQAGSDIVIALASLAAPFVLWHFTRQRRDFGMRRAIMLLAAFILACAVMHVLSMVVIWEPLYWLQGWAKAFTALLCVALLAVLWPLMPKVMSLPTPATLQKANSDLQTQMSEREKAEDALRHANITLELNVRERTLELSQANSRLQNEIEERNRVGEALRHSELLLRQFNDDLERYVDERTAELKSTIQELESFSYTISHDLRAPLRAINGYAEILREEHAAAVDDQGQALLEKIASNSVRMAQLIDGLLDFSRLSRTDRTSSNVDMTAVVHAVVADLQAQQPEQAATGARIEVHALPPAAGDSELLRQVWVQLISNALKFSARSDPPSIRIEGWEEGGETVFSIHDNGVGFDMQFEDKLFGVFQRLHPPEEFPGVGVGLAIARRIVERHGGHVWARSAPGHGASFFFALRPGTDAI